MVRQDFLWRPRGHKYYITGYTLCNSEIFEDLPGDIDCVFLPANGVGNNMNFADAKTFCQRIGAADVPIHCGPFDDKAMNDFGYGPRMVPEFFKRDKLAVVMFERSK